MKTEEDQKTPSRQNPAEGRKALCGISWFYNEVIS